MRDQELVNALRCVSTAGGPIGDCKKCPFYKTEPVPKNLKKAVSLTEWPSCDVDAVGLAAADQLENQSAHIAALQMEIEKLRGAAAPVAKESAELLEQRWIPVEERLPEYGARVLAFNMRAKNKYIGIWTREKDPGDGNDCWFDSAGWWYAFDEITHWMPLPEPPEVE